MENCLATIWLKDMTFAWASANAKGSFDSWASVDVSPAPSLRMLTLKNNGHIKKLRCLAGRENLDLWFDQNAIPHLASD
jgi:hypothetical protein